MYRIYSGTHILHHPNSGTVAIEAKISEEVNTQGSLDMVLDDPLFLNLRDHVSVYDDDGLIWKGRVLTIENSFNDRKSVHCEGALAFLCDTVVHPFAFRGRPDDYTDANNQLVKGLFHTLIDVHNAQLDPSDPRRFTVGRITVEDPNDYIYRSSESAMNVWEAIQTRLIDTLGGYVYLSGENLDVINYIADTSDTSDQYIQFGKNLIDLVQTNSADDIVTRLIPFGARITDETDPGYEPEPTQDGFHTWHGSRVHLSNPAYVENDTAKAKWGLIVGTNTWDDITIPENLATAATQWLANNFAEHMESIEATAADLSLNDASIGKIRVLQYVRVICEPLQIDEAMLCTRKETDLINVSETKVVIGRPQSTLSGMVGG